MVIFTTYKSWDDPPVGTMAWTLGIPGEVGCFLLQGNSSNFSKVSITVFWLWISAVFLLVQKYSWDCFGWSLGFLYKTMQKNASDHPNYRLTIPVTIKNRRFLYTGTNDACQSFPPPNQPCKFFSGNSQGKRTWNPKLPSSFEWMDMVKKHQFSM